MQQPAVFGIKVYDTEESTQVKDSPTRKVHRKYGSNPFHSGEGEYVQEEYFGTPTFYSEETKERERLKAELLPGSEQPVLQVLQEMLNSTKSQGLQVKDLVNVSHGHDEGARPGLSSSALGEAVTTPEYNNMEPQVYKHTQYQPGTTRSPSPSPSLQSPGEEEELYDSENDYKDKFKETWPYRTDDQYSLFYFHKSKEDKEVNEKEYPWPSLSEYEKEKYNFQPREPTKQENLNQEVAPLTTAGYDLSLLKIILNARVLKETTFIYFLRSRLSKAEKYERN